MFGTTALRYDLAGTGPGGGRHEYRRNRSSHTNNRTAVETGSSIGATSASAGSQIVNCRDLTLSVSRVQGAVDSYMWRVAKYPDGSTLVENEIIQKKLPANVDVRIRVIAGGVTFEDLSTERWITAADFSDVGEYKFRLLKPAGTPTACHIVQMYQAGALIGEAYYDGNLMPQE